MTTHITINSLKRVNYTGTTAANCQINLNRAIFANCAELSYFIIPNTFYNITEVNNTFRLDGNLITIDPGNYSLSQLFTEILTLLPAGSQILYNDVLNKVEITFLVNHTLDFTVSAFSIVLGYLPQLYPAAAVFISVFPPKIYQSIINIETSISNNMVNDEGKFSTFTVPILSNKGEMIIFNNRSQFSSRPKINNELKSIQVILKDEYGAIMQGVADWTLILAISEK